MTVTLGVAIFGALASCALGFLVAALLYRSAAARQAEDFDRYRGAMLDDWREVSNKVMRMRTIIHRSRSVAEVRDAVLRDDLAHPAMPIGVPVVRRVEDPVDG